MHAELSREPREEAPIMSAMHAGVMTTSTEIMYAQLVTLTFYLISSPRVFFFFLLLYIYFQVIN